MSEIRFKFNYKLDEYRGRDLNLISPSELHYLDSLVDEALTILATKSDAMEDTMFSFPNFAQMGNRYFNKIKGLIKENLSYDTIAAYDLYISTSISDYFPRALREDIPNDDDKKLALKEFREIVEIVLKDRTIKIPETLSITFMREIQRLDPQTYDFIKNKKIFNYFVLPINH